MNFISYIFLAVFPIATIAYFLIPGKIRYIYLMLVSLAFYTACGVKNLLVLVAVALISWLFGNLIYKYKKRWLFVIGIICTILCLLICKYTNFILDNTLSLFHISDEFTLNILMPLGISFYTFEAVSYLADIYTDKILPEKNILKYTSYIALFFSVTSGPIIRYDDYRVEITNIESCHPNYERIINGLVYVIYGFFLKLVLAGQINKIVESIIPIWDNRNAIELVIACVCYSIMIYADFAGYSAMAIGLAQIWGINIKENFRAPYLAHSIREFWQGWHISLSTWLRDYLYIPLGGNRKGKVRKYINLFLVFLISGIWHGAAWHYVAWGVIHGIYQIIGDILRPLKNKVYPAIGIRVNSISHRIMQVITTFVLATIAWIFFKSSLSTAVKIILKMFTGDYSLGTTFERLGITSLELAVIIIAMLFVLAVDLISVKKNLRIDEFMETQGVIVRGIVIVVLMLMILTFGVYGGDYSASQFVYFQY